MMNEPLRDALNRLRFLAFSLPKADLSLEENKELQAMDRGAEIQLAHDKKAIASAISGLEEDFKESYTPSLYGELVVKLNHWFSLVGKGEEGGGECGEECRRQMAKEKTKPNHKKEGDE